MARMRRNDRGSQHRKPQPGWRGPASTSASTNQDQREQLVLCYGLICGQVKGSGPGKSTSAEMRTVTHGCVQERICLGHGKGTMYARAETQHSLPPEEEDSSDKISLGAASSVGESTSSYVRPRQSSICHQARRRQCLHDLHGQDRILIRISRLMKP